MVELQVGGEAGAPTRAVSLGEALAQRFVRDTLTGLLCKWAKGKNENKQRGADIDFQIRKMPLLKLFLQPSLATALVSCWVEESIGVNFLDVEVTLRGRSRKAEPGMLQLGPHPKGVS